MLRPCPPVEMHVRRVAANKIRLSRFAAASRVMSMNLEIVLDLNAAKYYYRSCSHPSPLEN
jgi:hypothetical protein